MHSREGLGAAPRGVDRRTRGVVVHMRVEETCERRERGGALLLANVAAHPSQWVEWIVAAAAAFGFFFAVALINPAGLGMGDVKLALLVGAGLGWSVAAALILGTFAAAIYAVVLVLTRPGAGAKTSFALGPFLAGAAIVVLLLQ